MSVSDFSKPSNPGPPHKPKAFCRPCPISSAPTADAQKKKPEVLGAAPVAGPVVGLTGFDLGGLRAIRPE